MAETCKERCARESSEAVDKAIQDYKDGKIDLAGLRARLDEIQAKYDDCVAHCP